MNFQVESWNLVSFKNLKGGQIDILLEQNWLELGDIKHVCPLLLVPSQTILSGAYLEIF